MYSFKPLLLPVSLLGLSVLSGQSLQQTAESKIETLQGLIETAESEGIDTLTEKMSVRTAEVFLDYANWDQANIILNSDYFALVRLYKDNAAQMAADLPDFERNDVIDLLDESIDQLQSLIEKNTFRKAAPHVDWMEVTHEGDQLTYKDRPVFLADYTWKPHLPELTEYFGNLDGFFLTPSMLTDDNGTIRNNVIQDLQSKAGGTPGFIFIAHKSPPEWAVEKYGDEFTTFQGAPFHDYDIDHPGAREMISALLAGTVPYMAGKNYTQLGYMLCNEPRWITHKDGNGKVWYNGGVSNYTIEKFKSWLESKHVSIETLNTRWGTNFANFNSVTIDIPIDIAEVGTVQWYDWSTFNNWRVLEWFTFMKAEICKHDPEAKIQLKIMPSFFTENSPTNGIDLEALTEMSEIIGNDVTARSNDMRGPTEWEEHYICEWRELYMGYDFLKSVSPEKIVFNSESHLFSGAHSRNLYLDPKYARSITWAAHTLGLNASQIWYWPRREDGSLRTPVSNGYAGSNNQQPRVTKEIHATMNDLNAYAEEITAMQRQRKPLRIFYSKTSAAQNLDYMNEVFDLYESLNFEGISLGFATQNIIEKQNNNLWDAILLRKSTRLTQAERDALQSYLDQGGTIISDSESILENEYAESLSPLEESNGTLIYSNTVETQRSLALELLDQRNELPPVLITELNDHGIKTCTWKCITNSDGNQVLSIINLGNVNSTLDINVNGTSDGLVCKDLLTGVLVGFTPTLAPNDVLFVEIMAIEAFALGSEKHHSLALTPNGLSYYHRELDRPSPGLSYTAEWTEDLESTNWNDRWDSVRSHAMDDSIYKRTEHRLLAENLDSIFCRLKLQKLDQN